MRSCTGDSCFFCTNAPAPSRTPPPANLSNLWSTFGPSSSTVSSTSSAVSRCLKLAAGNHLTMRYCLSGTRAMMRSGNAMPYTPAHVTPYTAPRAVSWITVNFWVSPMGTRSTYAGCDSPRRSDWMSMTKRVMRWMNWLPGKDSMAMNTKYPQRTARGMSLMTGEMKRQIPTSTDWIRFDIRCSSTMSAAPGSLRSCPTPIRERVCIGAWGSTPFVGGRPRRPSRRVLRPWSKKS
mmetsp:Transcript_741/g.2868  ORF Transcript_741/g.2868 Transcript_741/m.2868 type:complete len:235 (-) Transcript_741:1165-1869(-)